MENIKMFSIDDNVLIKDIENKRFYIMFRDVNGILQKSEVPEEVFNIYFESKKIYKRNQNEEERHWEYSELTENSLYDRAFIPPKMVEDIIIEKEFNEKIHKSIKLLPKIQRERIVKYYFCGKNENQIAEEECCKHQSIHNSLEIGRNKIKNFLKK